jgi:hypothetical protein
MLSKQEGEARYAQAMHARRAGRYDEAGMLFLDAADAGIADACWEVANAMMFGGGIGFMDNRDSGEHFMLKGARLGHSLCRVAARAHLPDEMTHDADAPIHDLEARLFHEEMYPDEPDPLTEAERAQLRSKCDSHSDNPWPWYWCALAEIQMDNVERARSYMDQAAQRGLCCALTFRWERHFPHASKPHNDGSKLMHAARQRNCYGAIWMLDCADLGSFASARDIALAVELATVYRANYKDSTIGGIIRANRRNLPEDVVREVACRVGATGKRKSLAGTDIHYCQMYRAECVRHAKAAATAWLGCHKRRRLPHLNRDMVRLIGRALMDPVAWARFVALPSAGPAGPADTRIVIKFKFQRTV